MCKNFSEVTVRDRDVSFVFDIPSQYDWLKALPLSTVALVYYLK